MTKNPITREQAQAFDVRSYKNLKDHYARLDRWFGSNCAARLKKLTVFNKRSIVFDKDYRFTFKVVDVMEDGRYSVWPYYQISSGEEFLISEYLDTEFAESMEEIPNLIKCVLYYIRTRI